MRPLATIHLPGGTRHRGRFHTVALLVLFAGLAWITGTQQERPQPGVVDTMAALQDGCRRPTATPVQAVPDRPCTFAFASLPAR